MTGDFGAANQNRTDDLVITNDVLYRLSHSSILSPEIGAANQNRTDDLVITNDVLYRLSHSSMEIVDFRRLCYYTICCVICQLFFRNFSTFFILLFQQKSRGNRLGTIGAANQNRTDDLVITNDVLYRLSHSSISQRFIL